MRTYTIGWIEFCPEEHFRQEDYPSGTVTGSYVGNSLEVECHEKFQADCMATAKRVAKELMDKHGFSVFCCTNEDGEKFTEEEL